MIGPITQALFIEQGHPGRRHHEAFEDPLLASAGLDRLLHHAEVLVITGPSFRAQERQLSMPEPVLPTVDLVAGGR